MSKVDYLAQTDGVKEANLDDKYLDKYIKAKVDSKPIFVYAPLPFPTYINRDTTMGWVLGYPNTISQKGAKVVYVEQLSSGGKYAVERTSIRTEKNMCLWLTPHLPVFIRTTAVRLGGTTKN